MSFHLEFHAATPDVANAILDEEAGRVPADILSYIRAGLHGCTVGLPVYVKASGHLYAPSQNSYQTTSVTVQVNTVLGWRRPKSVEAA